VVNEQRNQLRLSIHHTVLIYRISAKGYDEKLNDESAVSHMEIHN
jgi:hypothetical protein